MSSFHAHIEAADEPGFVWLRTSAGPNPERKPAMRVARTALADVLLMLLDAATRFDQGEYDAIATLMDSPAARKVA